MAETKVTALRREMGLWAAMSIVVGTVIGSGIFIVESSKMVANRGTTNVSSTTMDDRPTVASSAG